MKTDRELLEAAAKAAGVNIDFADYRDLGSHVVYRKRDSYLTWWNPLTDDGDALRLAVKLHFTLRLYMGHACVQSTVPSGSSVYIDETDFNDPGAATRRAIVRAASAMVAG